MSSDERVPLDPDADSMRRLGYALVDRVVEHLTLLPDQRVARRGDLKEFSGLVDEPLPEADSSLDSCLDFFFERILPDLTRVNHPRFHAYIPCPSSFAGALGEMLAAGTNPFVGSWLGGSTVSALELTVLRWIAELLGYEPSTSFKERLQNTMKWFEKNWEAIDRDAEFPPGMSSAVKNYVLKQDNKRE